MVLKVNFPNFLKIWAKWHPYLQIIDHAQERVCWICAIMVPDVLLIINWNRFKPKSWLREQTEEEAGHYATNHWEEMWVQKNILKSLVEGTVREKSWMASYYYVVTKEIDNVYLFLIFIYELNKL